MELWAIATWLRARATRIEGNERGFVTAENIGYTVMAVVTLVAIFVALDTTGLADGIFDWVNDNIFSKTT